MKSSTACIHSSLNVTKAMKSKRMRQETVHSMMKISNSNSVGNPFKLEEPGVGARILLKDALKIYGVKVQTASTWPKTVWFLRTRQRTLRLHKWQRISCLSVCQEGHHVSVALMTGPPLMMWSWKARIAFRVTQI